MPIEKGESSGPAEAAANILGEIQEQVKSRVADIQSMVEEEAKQAQEAAEMEDFKRQIRETAEAAKAAKAARTYVVKAGDTLSAIAESLLGDASKWPAIFEANRDKLSDPNLIQVGQELNIP